MALVLFPAIAFADPQLGDLLFLMPKILLLGLYMWALEYFWWVVAATVGAWTFAIFFKRDIFWFLPDKHPESRFKPSTHGLLTVLLIAMVFTIFFGMILHAPIVSEAKFPSFSTQPSSSNLPTDVVVTPPQALERKYFNPMGGNWPTQSIELFTVPSIGEDSTFEVELDNREGQSDVYIKLCSVQGRCLRQAFLRKGSTLTLRKIVRRSHKLELRYIEIAAEDGIRVAKSLPFDAWLTLPVFVLPKRPGLAAPLAYAEDSSRESRLGVTDRHKESMFIAIARAEF
jgi:hypothetical protein